MFSAADVLVRDKLRTVHAGGFGAVTEVHMALVQNLDIHGTRLTTIAARASMTKQSMLELVDRAEVLGLVERRADPGDRRAKVVAFTPSGLAMLEWVREGVAVSERRMAAVVGASFVDEMRQRLTAYVAASGAAGLQSSGPNDEWRARGMSRVLSSASGAFARDVLGVVHAGGFDVVAEVSLALFRNLDVTGTRLTEIASRARMTKQAMAELVDKSEMLGFVARQPDPTDRRAKIVVFTPAGLQLLNWCHRGTYTAERRLATLSGKAFTDNLRAKLTAYVAAPQAIDRGRLVMACA